MSGKLAFGALLVLLAAAGATLWVDAAEPARGPFLITSSTATSTVTDLWVLDQAARTVYLCRASGSGLSPPACSKGTQLP